MPIKPYLPKQFGPTVTDAELILHSAMRKAGLRFRSQWGIQTPNGNFLVDFLVENRLVVEVDGSSHCGKTAERKDHWKKLELENAGYTVLRFRNIDVYKHLRQVVEKIKGVVHGEK